MTSPLRNRYEEELRAFVRDVFSDRPFEEEKEEKEDADNEAGIESTTKKSPTRCTGYDTEMDCVGSYWCEWTDNACSRRRLVRTPAQLRPDTQCSSYTARRACDDDMRCAWSGEELCAEKRSPTEPEIGASDIRQMPPAIASVYRETISPLLSPSFDDDQSDAKYASHPLQSYPTNPRTTLLALRTASHQDLVDFFNYLPPQVTLFERSALHILRDRFSDIQVARILASSGNAELLEYFARLIGKQSVMQMGLDALEYDITDIALANGMYTYFDIDAAERMVVEGDRVLLRQLLAYTILTDEDLPEFVQRIYRNSGLSTDTLLDIIYEYM